MVVRKNGVIVPNLENPVIVDCCRRTLQREIDLLKRRCHLLPSCNGFGNGAARVTAALLFPKHRKISYDGIDHCFFRVCTVAFFHDPAE